MEQGKLLNNSIAHLETGLKMIEAPTGAAFNLNEVYHHLKQEVEHPIISIVIMPLRIIWMPDYLAVAGTDPTIVNVR